MKLDRNTNRGGRGKYALVNMRKMIPILEAQDSGQLPCHESHEACQAFECLVNQGIITLGNETPGDQFFVMKYKDKFTAEGLRGYAQAVANELNTTKDAALKMELSEFCAQMFDESHAARKVGNRIPD